MTGDTFMDLCGDGAIRPERWNVRLIDDVVLEVNLKNVTPDEIMALTFETHDEASEFYTKYARWNGFGVRKADVVRDKKTNVIVGRSFVCHREGWRETKHFVRDDKVLPPKPATRTDCKARFRIKFDDTMARWVVAEFRDDHNHDMADTDVVHLIPSFRKMRDADKAQADSMSMYAIMVGQAGGHAEVGFEKKDLYNFMDKQRRARIEEGDSFAALSYLQANADSDSMFFGKFTLSEDDKLDNLFWSDGPSQVDYECFDDVLSFDTTYRTNKYNKPLVIFSGANHHNQTVIFACALLSDEKTETYKWVLKTFLEAMNGKEPKAVVTDGDNAMREAILCLFPGASHRLCAWHLHRNGYAHVKNTKFLDDLKVLIYGNMRQDQFEKRWTKFTQKYRVTENSWVKKMHRKKHLWAAAYMRDKFFAGVRTTSRCEDINAFIERYVLNKHSLVDFLNHFDRGVRDKRANELRADFKSTYYEPVFTQPLEHFQKCVAKHYTSKIFGEVKNNIANSGGLVVDEKVEEADNVTYRVTKPGKPHRVTNVKCDSELLKFECDCSDKITITFNTLIV